MPVAANTSPPPTDEIVTAEAMAILGYKDRSSVTRLVKEGQLQTSRRLPGKTGDLLFWRRDVQRLADERAASKAS